jgi:hypothetical protein
MDEQSYDPVVPVKVENRRASERSGHGIHWREGGNKVTYMTYGNIPCCHRGSYTLGAVRRATLEEPAAGNLHGGVCEGGEPTTSW